MWGKLLSKETCLVKESGLILMDQGGFDGKCNGTFIYCYGFMTAIQVHLMKEKVSL